MKTAESTGPGTSEVAREIAGVAARLFATRGFDATPVRAIAEAAGVTKPTLYYHFGSKQGLAQALLTVPLTRQVDVMRSLVEGPGDSTDLMERWAEAHFAFCRAHPDRVRFFYALFFGPLNSGLAAELGRFGERFDALLLEAVRRAAGAGRVDPDRVEACTAALRALIVIHTMDFLYRGEGLGPDLAARLVDDLLRGFGPAPADRANGTGGPRIEDPD